MEAVFCVPILVTVLFLLPVLLYYWANRGATVPELQRKCVVVTGCDSGFGHEVACTLDSMGLHVFAGCLTEEGENNLKQKCSQRVQTIRMDVTKPDDVQRCLACATNFLDTTRNTVLWAVINNAGVGGPAPIDWVSVQSLKRVFDVNVWGMMDVTKTFLRHLKRSQGRIVNVASAAGKFSVVGAGAYSPSKFAVNSFSDLLRNELRPFGVSVHIIDPGFFKTNITDYSLQKKTLEKLWSGLSQETKDEYGEDFINESLTSMQKMCGLAARDISPVIQAMVHAVTSTRPKLRYVLGWDHRFVWRWLAMLPSDIQDFMLNIWFNAKPKAAVM